MRSGLIGSPAPCRSTTAACRRRRDEAGFTLIEVLVAFVLLSLALGAVIRAFSDSTRRIDSTAAWEIATQLAESRLATVGIETPLGPGEQEGRFADARFSWRQSVRAPADATSTTAPLVPYIVELTVSWEERGSPRSLALTTLRLARATSG